MKHDHSAFGIESGVGIKPAFDPRPLQSADGLFAASMNAYPIVARRTVNKDRVAPVAGAACALLLGAATFWSLTSHRTAVVSQRKAAASEDTRFLPRQVPPALETLPKLADAPMPVPPIAAPTAPLPTSPASAPETAMAPETSSAQVSSSANVTSSTTADTGAVHRGFAPMLVVDGGSPVEENGGGAAAKDGASDSDTASATHMSDPSRTISQGSLIPAVLETAIDSDLPGFARAVVTQDVYSFDRSTVLVPRSSRLVGEYKSGLADGQKRVYVTWTRLIRPDGVSVAISSPATAPSGGTGLPGQVNSHFMARFGSAILLTVVGAASAVGSSGLVLAGSQSAASVAATHDSAIPPTIRIRPGQPVRVFTARDLDFSTIVAAKSR